MVCSQKCAIKYSAAQNKKKAKEVKEKVKQVKESLKTKKDYIKILQIVFNKYIRKRDEKKGCISCSTKVAEEFHAGHYIPTTYQYLRFNEYNVHKQCSKCNTHLRGNQVAYRENLIKKIGLERVLILEADRHKEFNLSIEDLKYLIIKYKELAKD
jgi:hypothetical protein